MAEKLLSIIVPSYNMEDYLPKCLGSLIVDDDELLQQLDVIVVNDGSQDRTSEIAHDFEHRYPGVFRVIDKPNGHYGSCINAALPVAQGTYVKVLDADDWFDTVAFGMYLDFLREHTGIAAVDLVINDIALVYENQIKSKSYAFVTNERFDISKFDFQGGRDLWMHGVAYRTSNLRRIGYQQMTGISHTDVQWIHTPMSAVGSVAYCPVTLYMYQAARVGNTSSTEGFYKTFHDLVSVTERMLEEFKSLTSSVDSVQRKYLETHLRYRVMRVYRVYLIEHSPLLKCGVLEEFDAFLMRTGLEFYREMDELTLGSVRHGFHYVTAWRRSKSVFWRRKLYEFVLISYRIIKKVKLLNWSRKEAEAYKADNSIEASMTVSTMGLVELANS